MNKIQNLYELSIDAASTKDYVSQKKYILSAINYTENAIKRTPLDADLHFTRGKLYSLLDGNEDKIKSSFKIESALDPAWVSLPLRQSKVWLFIDIEETRRLWTEVLVRSNKLDSSISKYIWNKILSQASQHPIHIRNVYEIIMAKDDYSYIKHWMNLAGAKNLSSQIPTILKSDLLSGKTKKDIISHWKRLFPKDYKRHTDSIH